MAGLDPDILIQTLKEREDAARKKASEQHKTIARAAREAKAVTMSSGYKMCVECEMPIDKCECRP
jgi:hypothetical protein